ncbi:hypothetical protein BWD42_07425 [Sphingobacterium sp. CZ-UAM]|uniref:DUF4843 domain-containing protein n=1 Tax=Sphingobacterium sp. CZ-UAM TaxID=1933868 RepID=UPI0009856C22|nr:DUF4843 domain-containing protein [Sphingobacterium sp. CZ-UAM]OOG19725.1 hypothetical protein BWD42_07425 [Sphingobacterium sp. CZ-UAM]
MNRILFFIACCLLLPACSKRNGLITFDPANAFIEFDAPQINLGNMTNELDRLSFSFAFEADTLRSKIVAVPIRLIGQQADIDRPLELLVGSGPDALPDSLFRMEPAVLHARRFQDTLYIHIKRDNILKNKQFSLTVAIQDNSILKPGSPLRSQFKLLVYDQLPEPPWWRQWTGFFGPFRKEVYRQWMRVYYPGADPTDANVETGKPYFSWYNMPKAPFPTLYPLTFNFIDQLKKYFETHAVYPDNDLSQPRIYLP